MSKKHFIALAETIRQVAKYADLNETQHRLLAQGIADLCERHNTRFDYQRFVTACGVEKGN